MIHAVYDVTDCTHADAEADELLDAMRTTVTRLGCRILGELPVTFQPHGTTCVLILAESHLTVSTWPEFGLVHIDLFSCRADTDPDDAIGPILLTVGGRTQLGRRMERLGPPGPPWRS